MLRERRMQIGLDALDAVLTSTPGVLYGFYLLTRPADDRAVYGGLAAVVASLLLKLTLVASRRPAIWVRVKDEAEAAAKGKEDRTAYVWWPED